MYKKYTIFSIIFILFTINIYSEFIEKETKYFKLIYDTKLEDISDKVANRIDTLAEKEFKYYSFYPEEKILVHIRDNNIGESSKVDRRTIILYPNVNKSFYEERYFSNWIDYYLANNLSKLIIELKIGGAFKHMWKMKYTLHNLFLPNWLKEGIGIYSEEKFGSTEGTSILFDMFIDKKIKEGNFKGLKLTSLKNEVNKYYGYSFIKFYIDKYGEDNFIKAIEEFSNNQIVGPVKAFTKYSGKDNFKEVELEWKNYLKIKYEIDYKITKGISLYESDVKLSKLKLYKDKLYLYKENKGIIEYDILTKKGKKKYKANLVGGYELTDEGIYYSKLNPSIINNNNEILVYKKDKRLKLLEEKGIVDFLKMPYEMVYVSKKNGVEELISDKGKVFVSSEYNFIFQKIQYQDGYIYFSAKQDENLKTCIYRVDVKKMSIEKIVEGENPYIFDNEIYYLNKKDNGISIYKYDLATNKNKSIKLTGFITEVAFYNGELYYIEKDNNKFILKKSSNIMYEDNIVEKKEKEKVEIENKEEINKKDFNNEVFKNTLKLKDAILTNQGVIFSFQDELLRHTLLVGNTAFLSRKDNFKNLKNRGEEEGYYFEDEKERIEKGVFLLYMYSVDAFPMPLVNLNIKQSYNENYSKLTLNYPYFLKKSGVPIFSGLTVDTDDHWRLSASIAGALGVAEHLDKGTPYTELFFNYANLSLKYYISQEAVDIEENLGEKSVYQLPHWDISLLASNMDNTKKAFKANYLWDYKYEINKGTIGGRNILKNLKFTLDTTFLNWENIENDSNNSLLVLNPSINNEIVLNYYLNLNIGVGYIKRYDLKENEDMHNLTYVEFSLEL